MSNKITKKTYCIKRLRDCGYRVDKIDSIQYSESDNRKWSAIIDPGGMSIIITCFNDDTLHLYDGNQYLPTNQKLNTLSIEVLVDYLNSKGLIHKHRSYGINSSNKEAE